MLPSCMQFHLAGSLASLLFASMPHDSSGCWVSFLGGIGLAAKINFYPAKTYFPSRGPS